MRARVASRSIRIVECATTGLVSRGSAHPWQVQSIAQIEAAAAKFKADYLSARKTQIQKVVVGHEEIVDGVLTCLFAGGHALLEGVPGLGKTLLIRSLSEALHLSVLAHPVHA